MKVLFVTTAYPSGASDPRGTFIHELARTIVAEGVAVTVLAPGAPGAPKREKRDGVSVYRAQYWLDRWQGLAVGLGGIVPNLQQRPWLAAQIPALLGTLTRHALALAPDADIIHAHWLYPSGIAALAAARWCKKPLVLTSHGGDFNLAFRVPILRATAAHVARKADACIGVSRPMVESFLASGVSPSRVHSIPYGFSEACMDDVPHVASNGLPRFRDFDGLRVLYVGSLIPRKSVDTLLHAVREVGRTGSKATVAVIGDGPAISALVTLASTDPALDVMFVGEQSPLMARSYMRAADVLVLPSRSEGRPLVILEAMAHSLPVIATDIGGNRELVDHASTGLLFPVGDISRLSSALQWVADHPREAKRMGERGRDKMLAEGLTGERIASRHVSLYESLAAAARSAGHRL